MIPGDVIYYLQQKPHSRRWRSGDDLHHKIQLSLEEALLGYRKETEQLDGRHIEYSHGGVTKPYEVRTIDHQGMPQHDFPWKHDVENEIKYPEALIEDQKHPLSRILKS